MNKGWGVNTSTRVNKSNHFRNVSKQEESIHMKNVNNQTKTIN